MKAYPHNVEAENALLACFLLAEDTHKYIGETTEDFFYYQPNRAVFSVIKKLYMAVAQIDTISVYEGLRKNGDSEKAGGMEYLTELMNTLPSAAMVKDYYNIVRNNAILRSVINVGTEIVKAGAEAEKAEVALSKAESLVFGLTRGLQSTKLEHVGQCAAEVYNTVKTIQNGEYISDGIKSGFGQLDSFIEHFQDGNLYIIAARPSVGKTALSLTLALSAAIAQEKKVAIYSLEMPQAQLVQRMLTTLSKVSFYRQNKKQGLTIEENTRYFNAFNRVFNTGIYINDSSIVTPVDILSQCRMLKAQDGLDMVIIDYLQLMTMGGVASENRTQEVSSISRLLKVYARELNVPVIVLSQMSRSVEMRGGEPKLSDLRESGSIEQDADVVMFLHRINKETVGGEARSLIKDCQSPVKIMIEKNRHGRIGSFYMDFLGDTQSFADVSVKQNPFEGLKPVQEKLPY